jgi:hypothetical protein
LRGRIVKRGILIAGALLALAAIGYTAVWFHGASRLEQAVAAWKEEAEGNGLTITHDEIKWGGFPFALTAVVPDLSIRNEAEGARIEAAPIRVRTTLWNPNRVAYDFSGTHALAVTQGLQSFQARLDVETGGGEVLLTEVRRFDQLSAANLRIVAKDGIFRIDRLEASGSAALRATDAQAESMRSTYTLTGVSFSSRLGVKLIEPPIERVRLDLAATGPFLEIFEDGTLVDWAQAGGVGTLRELSVEWSGLTLTATGSGRFDPDLRPSGTITLVSAGFEESLDDLERSGALPPQIGQIVRALSEPFIVPAANGGKSQLIVPVTAENGLLSVGGEPMGMVPSLKAL